MNKLEYILKCDALLDQNRYIGDDPVGHACSNDAAYETSWIDGASILICESCKEILLSDLKRLTFYTPYTGSKYQEEMVKRFIKDFNTRLTK